MDTTTKAVKKSAWRRGLLLAGIGVLSAGSVAGVSFALTSDATAAPTTHVVSTQTAAPSTNASAAGWRQLRRARIRQILRRAVSGQIELATKNGFVTVDFNRGSVTSISSSSISVLRADSQKVTDSISSTTHMPKRGVPKDGQQVVVISENGQALYIFFVGSPAARPVQGSSTSSASSGSGSTT
jgi:hypothetical protein